MRFGFVIMPVGPHPIGSHAHIVELVRFGEQHGFDVAWMPDQTFYRDPYVTLAAVALSTSKITLGVGATNPTTRHPAMSARAAATLAEISGGRFILALGAGNRRDLLEPLGLPVDHAGPRCREAVLTIKRLLSGETVTHESSSLVMRGVQLQARMPLHVPVYLGARGPRILQAAGAVADGAIIGGFVSDAGLDFALGHIRKGAAAAGRNFRELEVVNWVTTVVTDRRADLLDAVRPTVAYIIGGAPPAVLQAVGIPAGVIRRVKVAYGEGGIRRAAPLIDAASIDKFTIVGGPAEVAERISQLCERGVGQIAVLMPATAAAHSSIAFDMKQNLIRFSEDVIPRLDIKDRRKDL